LSPAGFRSAAIRDKLVSAYIAQPSSFQIPPRDPRLSDWLNHYPPWLFSEQLYRSIEVTERYSIEVAVDLLRRLDLIGAIDQWRSADELCQTLCFQPRFRFALKWILERLVETGCIEVRIAGATRSYRLRSSPWQADLAQLREAALQIHSGNAATLDLLDCAASLYPSVGRGDQSAEQNLFSPERIPLWLNYFDNDNLTYAVNNWVTAVLVADCVRDRASIRILEVGAGGGSGSEILLRWFEERAVSPRIERYLITEPNAFFRRRAQRAVAKRYAHLPLEWGALDLNTPWHTQGIAPGEFDLVFAVNVLHIAKNLLFSLAEAGLALASGGWLIIGECLRPYVNQPIYPELMFQILESFTDVELDPELRPNPGFLTPEQWRNAFARGGFENIKVDPNIESIREFYPHFFTGGICGQNVLGK
jgi:SAM-dependent methyltransferase